MDPIYSLPPLDAAIVGTYLSGILAITAAVSWWRWRKERALKDGGRMRSGTDSAHDFFLASESAPWWAVAGSYFASNIGSDAIVGLSSAGATVGISAGFFDFASGLAFLVLAYLCLPVYRASGVFTLPEFASKRYPGPLRMYLSVVALLLYVINKTSVALFCGAILIEAVLAVDGSLAVGGLLLLTCVFSLVGGLSAVIAVEVLNTALLLIGGSAAAGLALRAVGGWDGLHHAIATNSAQANTAGLTASFLHLRQSGGMYALPALLLGAPWSILWFHCADQEMVQRGLAGRSMPDARLGSVIAGFLKLTVPWTWAVPGIVARLLYPSFLGCPTLPPDEFAAGGEDRDSTAFASHLASPEPSSGNATSPAHGVPGGLCLRSNLAYPSIMVNLLPTGLLGIVFAASLAGVMSVLASTFNSASTIVATDIYRRLHPRASPWSLVWAGRAWILIMTGLAVLWLPLLSRLSPSLYVSMQLLNAALAPPIVVVFFAALLWPRANSTGALACLILGHSAGILRTILAAAYPEGSVEVDNAHPLVQLLAGSNFLLYSAAVGALSTVAIVVVSLLTPPPARENVEACTHRLALAWCSGQKTTASSSDRMRAVASSAERSTLEPVPVVGGGVVTSSAPRATAGATATSTMTARSSLAPAFPGWGASGSGTASPTAYHLMSSPKPPDSGATPSDGSVPHQPHRPMLPLHWRIAALTGRRYGLLGRAQSLPRQLSVEPPPPAPSVAVPVTESATTARGAALYGLPPPAFTFAAPSHSSRPTPALQPSWLDGSPPPDSAPQRRTWRNATRGAVAAETPQSQPAAGSVAYTSLGAHTPARDVQHHDHHHHHQHLPPAMGPGYRRRRPSEENVPLSVRQDGTVHPHGFMYGCGHRFRDWMSKLNAPRRYQADPDEQIAEDVPTDPETVSQSEAGGPTATHTVGGRSAAADHGAGVNRLSVGGFPGLLSLASDEDFDPLAEDLEEKRAVDAVHWRLDWIAHGLAVALVLAVVVCMASVW